MNSRSNIYPMSQFSSSKSEVGGFSKMRNSFYFPFLFKCEIPFIFVVFCEIGALCVPVASALNLPKSEKSNRFK